MFDAGFFDRAQHLLGVGERVGQGLLADDVLARCCGGHHLRMMHVAGSRDVDHVDVLALDHPPPVGLDLIPAKLPGGRFRAGAIASADYFEARREFAGKEPAHLPVSVRVSLTHELVSEETDVDFRHGALRV